MLRHLETAPAGRASRPWRALVLMNPGARRGTEGVKPALERLRAAGIETPPKTFSGPAEISRDVLRRAGGVDAVFVCGGDGTVSRGPRDPRNGAAPRRRQ